MGKDEVLPTSKNGGRPQASTRYVGWERVLDSLVSTVKGVLRVLEGGDRPWSLSETSEPPVTGVGYGVRGRIASDGQTYTEHSLGRPHLNGS